MSRQAREVAERFGCPKFIGVKVESCIRHSERYDCLLMPKVDVIALDQEMGAIGGSIEVMNMDEFEFEGRTPSLSQYLLSRYGRFEFVIDGGSFCLEFSVDYDEIRAREPKIAY
jgi:hypothetical protein